MSFSLLTLVRVLGDPWKYNIIFILSVYIYKYYSHHTLLSEVWQVRFWMRLLGSKYPKRSVIWGNSRKIWKFKTGKLRGQNKRAKNMLVKKYRDSNGKARFVGKAKPLKHSACLDRTKLVGNEFLV